MGEIVKKGWSQYMLQLQLHPLRTKMITAGILAGISDSTAQKLSGIKKIELRRLLLKMLFGFAYGGPFGHVVHKALDSIFKGKRDKKTVAKKVLLEQVTLSPWNNLVFLFYYGLVVEILAYSGMDKPSIHASPATCDLSKFCCVLLGNIS
ncbi:peroxisomal membrane protein PMP22-like isoform X2 [Carex rostrata]